MNLVYIMVVDTCPPNLLVYQVSTTGNTFRMSPMLNVRWPSLDRRACPPHVRRLFLIFK
jgi:hypothetical protein